MIKSWDMSGFFCFSSRRRHTRSLCDWSSDVCSSDLVREKIGPVAAFKLAITVNRLPKTRSGKILRGTMKKIADKEPWTMPATIDDPAVLDEIGVALKGRGYGA